MCKLTFLNCDSLSKNLRKAMLYLHDNPDIVAVTIDQDDKYYLIKTPYRYEIRMVGSTTWITYAMHRDIPFDQCIRRLSRKYINLVANCSNPKHFDGQIECVM